LSEPFPDSVGALAMWRAAVGNDWFDSSLLSLPRSGDGIHSTPAGYTAWATDVWHWASGVIGAIPLGEVSEWRGELVPPEWMKRRLSFREAEAEMDKEHRRVERLPGAGRYPRATTEERWLSFKAGAMPGDELWYYDSPREDWMGFCGRRGYAIVRGGVAVDSYTTALN
jgi:hypothetical protein